MGTAAAVWQRSRVTLLGISRTGTGAGHASRPWIFAMNRILAALLLLCVPAFAEPLVYLDMERCFLFENDTVLQYDTLKLVASCGVCSIVMRRAWRSLFAGPGKRAP